MYVISVAIATNCNQEISQIFGFFPNGSYIGGNEATEISYPIKVFNNFYIC